MNAEWKKKSTNEIIAGCVTALDGFFQRCNKHTKKETRNTFAYYSGHYECYGVNCQACVRVDLRLNDNIAFPQALGLKDLFDSLPLGLYGVGDAAYTLMERLLVPFTGSQRLDPAKVSFNYYLLQLRIRVEMVFGRLVNKFRIKINGSLDRVSAIPTVTACVRLHHPRGWTV